MGVKHLSASDDKTKPVCYRAEVSKDFFTPDMTVGPLFWFIDRILHCIFCKQTRMKSH